MKEKIVQDFLFWYPLYFPKVEMQTVTPGFPDTKQNLRVFRRRS